MVGWGKRAASSPGIHMKSSEESLKKVFEDSSSVLIYTCSASGFEAAENV